MNKSEDWSFTGTFEGEYPKAGTLTYRDNERTLEIRSQSWQRVSVCSHKPVPVDKPIPEIQQTHTPSVVSTLRLLYKKIHEAAVKIKKEFEWQKIKQEDRDSERAWQRGHQN